MKKTRRYKRKNNKKKTVGMVLGLLLAVSLVLVGLFGGQILHLFDDPEENIGTNEGDSVEDGEGQDSGADDGIEPDTKPDESVNTEPLPEPEIGVETEYTEAFEILDGETLPEHILTVVFEESILGEENLIPVKVYFGTFLTSDNAQNIEDTVVRISLCDESGGSLLIAEMQGKDFYNGKYLCSISSDETESSMLEYCRVIEMNVPGLLTQNEKGMLTFSIACSFVDKESGVEMLSEKTEKSIWYKKTQEGYELSDEKETTNIYSYEYSTDISKYIGYIEPTGDLWSNDYLLLVNPWNPIEKGQEFTYDVVAPHVRLGDIGEYYFGYRPNLEMNTTAAKALTAMFKEATASSKLSHSHFQIVSAYRDYEWQESLFNRNVASTKKYVCKNADCEHEYITKNSYKKCEICGSSVMNVTITEEEARNQVATYSCAPGTSEHQTGLTVDIADLTKSNAILEEPFKDTAAGKWLAENCTRFGFVLRFEKDKEDITGIIYEPWHFRYVGRYHATRMTELDMCLEEYVEFLTEEGYFDDPDSVHNPANMEVDPDTFLIVERN